MKTLKLLAIAAVCMTALASSCSKPDLDIDATANSVVSPDNARNPFDAVGKLHNEAIKLLGFSPNFPNFSEKDVECATCLALHKFYPDLPCDFSLLAGSRIETLDSVGSPAVEAIGDQIAGVVKMDTTIPPASAYQALHAQVVAIEDAAQSNPGLTEMEKTQVLINASVARHSAYLWGMDITQGGDSASGAWYPTLQCPNSERGGAADRLSLNGVKKWIKKNIEPLKNTVIADAKGALMGAVKGAIASGTWQGALVSAGKSAVTKSATSGVTQNWH